MPDYKERPEWEKQAKNSLLAAWLVMREDLSSSLMTGRPISQSAIESRLASSLAYPTVDAWGQVYERMHWEVTGEAPKEPDQVNQSISHVAAIALLLSRSIEEDFLAARFTGAEQLELGAALETEARARAFDILSDARLESIAITETTRAITEAEKSAATDLGNIGITLTAYWNTERDNRVCPICRPLHGRKLTEIALPFIGWPPAHPRCRCYLTWINDGEN